MTLTSVEFEATIGDQGHIVIPRELQDMYALESGTRLRVRITEHTLAARLRERGVSDEEIQHIGDVQLESRENDVAFLLAEGASRPSRGRKISH